MTPQPVMQAEPSSHVEATPRVDPAAPYRFARHGFAVTSPFLSFVLICEIFLWLSGETVPIKTVATHYDREGPPSAYLPGLIGQQFNLFHYERVKKLRPEVLVLGSSRVTRFRQEMFGPKVNFYNSGRTISCIGDLEQYFAALPTDYSPRALLLGIDSWWFNGSLPTPTRFGDDIKEDETKTVNAHIYAYRRLIDLTRRGIIDRDLVVKILRRDDAGVKRFGMIAWKNAGMRNDGSNQTFDRSTRAAYQDGLPEEIANILKLGHPSLLPATTADDKLLGRLEAALRKVEAKGTKIIAFAPPFASEVHDAYTAHPAQYAYYADYKQKVQALFKRNGWYFFDGSDPITLGMDDRSMKDRDHAQETYHVALLGVMAKDASVRNALHLDPQYLSSLLAAPKTTPWYPDYRQ